MTLELDDLRVRILGECRYDSPFAEVVAKKRTTPHYVHEDDRVLIDDTVSVLLSRGVPLEEVPSLEAAGPRRKLYFDPGATRVGIVTCGELCPGLNDVIRAIVQELTEHYRVAHISGFRNGFAGLTSRYRDRVLIPEVPFALDGGDGLLHRVEEHIRRHGQVVLVVAEGGGQDLLEQAGETSYASGNTSSATSGSSSRRRSPSTWSRSTCRRPCATSTRATPSAASPPTPTTASTACAWPTPRSTRAWPGAPRPSWCAGGAASCTSRCR